MQKRKPPRQIIAEAMEAKKVSQADLARLCDTTSGTVNNWLSGRRGLAGEYVFKVAEALGLNPRDLVAPKSKPARVRARARSAAKKAVAA